MNRAADFSADDAHVYFSRFCFNKAWELIEKPDRTESENEEMIRLNQASVWHWTQRSDCSESNLAIGYWQASRIRSLLGHADEAKRYANLCLQFSKSLSPFYQGYAYEALARAELMSGNAAAARANARHASELAANVEDEDERKLLLDDLATLT